MNISLKPASFRRDRLTILSIASLAMVILTEIVLIFWLPYQARSAYLWEKQVAEQEMLQTLDQLRGDLDGLKTTSSRQGNEVMLVRGCLDELARYLRTHGSQMSVGQINDVYQVLLDFGRCYDFFKHGGVYSSELRLDLNPALRQIFAESTPVIENKQ